MPNDNVNEIRKREKNMNMKPIIWGLLLSAATFFSPLAIAADEAGPYLGVGIGQTKVKDLCNVPGLILTSCKDTDTAFKIFGGYEFTKNWAAELAYVDFGKYPASGTVAGIPVSFNAKANGWVLEGVGTWPIADQFGVFGKIGAIVAKVDLSESGGGVAVSQSSSSTSLTFGVGAKWDFAQHFAARVEFERFNKVGDSSTTGTADIDLFSVGVSYKF